MPASSGVVAHDAARPRTEAESAAIERALFWGRIAGGVIILALGPSVTPRTPALLFQALGLYMVGYAALMVALTQSATTAAQRRRLLWLGHAFDTLGFLGAMALSASEPSWLAVNAAPLYVLVTVARLGAGGGVLAAAALSLAHVALALWRVGEAGVPLHLSGLVVQVAVYALAALLAGALDMELRPLRARRDLQVAVHEPLLEAHDDLGLGVLVSEGGRAVYVSAGLARMTGYAEDEIKALPSVFELIPEDERAAAIEATRALPARGGNISKVLRRKDGRRIEVEIALRRYEHDGRARSVAIIRDVTLRRRATDVLATAPERTFRLTERERQVLRLLAEGCDSKTIAARLGLSVHTARDHVQNVLEKMGARSRLEAVARANELGLVQDRS